QALGLDELLVLGTHCVDNSPTPERALNFVSALPSVGKEQARQVVAYEFMADFRVHARIAGGEGEGEKTVKDAYLTLPPSIGVPSIADSCYACFDYTNGLADLVVGYMGAPFDRDSSEMGTAPLMVTVRNPRGRALLENAVSAGRVSVLQRGGKGGVGLQSEGDRDKITRATFRRDSLVQTLTDPSYVPAEKGAPKLIGEFIAQGIARTLPKGMEFARYSIDYHYLRNLLFVEERMGMERAAEHVPGCVHFAPFHWSSFLSLLSGSAFVAASTVNTNHIPPPPLPRVIREPYIPLAGMPGQSWIGTKMK
ncbi:MAG: hypothetical protein SGPRY_006874, partial [Prymnesium sp.]